MNTRARTRRRWLVPVLAAIAACGDNLIADPSFDLWCDGKLCKPWRSTGTVTRVGSWHEHDYAVSLGRNAVLSQLTEHDPVECIAFEVIADVAASADVWLELDFRDDGTSEYKQLVPESHFAKLRYLIKAPTWYDSLRFILRKKGTGRAVLAQIKATPSDECKGDALPLPDRPLGAGCDEGSECESGVCAHAPALFQAGLAAENDEGDTPFACSECAKDADCAADERCGAAFDAPGGYRSCVATRSLDTAEWCLNDVECESNSCADLGALTHGTCGQCKADADCDAGEVCGVQLFGVFAARGCIQPPKRGLGEVCAVDGECDSGACKDGACSECNKELACKAGRACGWAEQEWLTVEASLCDPGSGERRKGAACTHEDDCASGRCDEPDPICQLCIGDGCQAMSTEDCGFVRRLAGTCR